MLVNDGTILIRATVYTSEVNFTPSTENVLIGGSCISLIPILLRKGFVALADLTVLCEFLCALRIEVGADGNVHI